MIKKLQNALKFDPYEPVLIVARDGEKFYVCQEKNLKTLEMMTSDDLKNLDSLLEWAMLRQYPLKKFVRLQKYLVETYFE